MEKYTLPRGTQDFLPERTFKLNYIESVLKEVAGLFDFHEIRTPIFEHTQLFTRSVGESSDIVNKEMYTFLDRSNRSLTLRPEGTASVIRSFVENKLYAQSDYPLKLYYNGPVFRYERPQAGRFRQIHQFGYEALGIRTPYLDAEMIFLAVSSLFILGMKNIKVKVNSIGDLASRQDYTKALKEYFAPHLEELCEDCNRRYTQNPLRILDCKVDGEGAIVKGAPKIKDFLNKESKEYFAQVVKLLNEYEIQYEVDENLVRGLDYYSDVVFEIVDLDHLNYGAIGAGGRYDHLVEELGGPSLPSVGFAFGVDRLLLVMDEDGLFKDNKDSLDCYVMPMNENVFNYAFQVAQFLRGNGVKTELDYQNRSIKSQFKTVERKNAQFAIIIGEDEAKSSTVTIKNTKTQEQTNVVVADLLNTLDKMFQEQYAEEEHHHHCHCEDRDGCDCEHEHEEDHECSCSHDHDEMHECCCGDEHDEKHECCCGDEHGENHECSCGSEHEENHECCQGNDENCACKHNKH